MDLQALLNSRYSVGLALALGRALPPGLAYRLTDWFADRLAGRTQSRLVQAVRANQWVVSQGQLDSGELERITRATLRHTGRCLYDFYHYLNNPDAIRRLVRFSPEFERCRARIREGQAGTLIVCPHLSNSDMAGQALGLENLNIQVLSYPQPTGGYRWQNRIRSSVGLQMTPTSVAALRQAEEKLRSGGVVLTGLDRPISGSKYLPRFFGRPASLPVTHVRLALKFGIPITVIACQQQPDGSYCLLASDPIPMEPHPDRMEETLQNAEALLRVVEAWIQRAPDQWAMFYPVWPEAINELRGEL